MTVDKTRFKKSHTNVGRVDMVLQFGIHDTGITCDTTAASLTGRTRDGRDIGGLDTIKTLGCNRRVAPKLDDDDRKDDFGDDDDHDDHRP